MEAPSEMELLRRMDALKRLGLGLGVLAMGLTAMLWERSHGPDTALASAVTFEILDRTPKTAEGEPEARRSSAVDFDETGRRYLIPVTATQPSQGPQNALVTVVSWCGFTQPACRKAEPIRQALQAKHGDDLRWVFRALPERTDDLHLYLFAEAAHMQAGRFSDVRERLLDVPRGRTIAPNELEPLARELGLDWNALVGGTRTYAGYIEADRRLAQQFGVDGPTHFVNGRPLRHTSVPRLQAALDSLIEAEKASAQALVDSGTPRDDVYRALTADGYWGIADDPSTRAASMGPGARPREGRGR